MTETIPVYAEPDWPHVETCGCKVCMQTEVHRLTEEVEILRQTVKARDASIRQLRNALKA